MNSITFSRSSNAIVNFKTVKPTLLLKDQEHYAKSP